MPMSLPNFSHDKSILLLLVLNKKIRKLGMKLRLQVRSTRGSQTDVVCLALRGLTQLVQLCKWSPNKLWRSNSIFNLWDRLRINLPYIL